MTVQHGGRSLDLRLIAAAAEVMQQRAQGTTAPPKPGTPRAKAAMESLTDDPQIIAALRKTGAYGKTRESLYTKLAQQIDQPGSKMRVVTGADGKQRVVRC
jgi:hypothetical protein